MFRELVDTGVHDLFLKHVEPGEFASAIPKVRAGSTVIAADVQEAHVTTLGTSSVYSASNMRIRTKFDAVDSGSHWEQRHKQ